MLLSTLLSTLANHFRFHTEYHTGRGGCKSRALCQIQTHRANSMPTVKNRARPGRTLGDFVAVIHDVTIKSSVISIPDTQKSRF